QLERIAEERPGHRGCLPVAQPAVQILRQREARGAESHDPEPQDGDDSPQDVQPCQAPHSGEPAVQREALFKPEHQYTPSYPRRLATEFAPITRISPTSPLNSPTAEAKLSCPFSIPIV